MALSLDDVLALEALDNRLRILLPELYRDSYQSVSPAPMGSAPLKYDAEGRVAWNEIWSTFCNLAMAGGPPHRGTLLQPAGEDEIAADPDRYNRVAAEVVRGITLVSELPAAPATQPGWVSVECRNAVMAAWLQRAAVMENVLARSEAAMLYLPAGPDYRVTKEIRNVVTTVAKTCHYWTSHMPPEQQQAIAALLEASEKDTPLLEPASLRGVQADPITYRKVLGNVVDGISESTGAPCFPYRYAGWLGVEAPDVRSSVWLMRAMVANNILARREAEVVFLPVSPAFSSNGQNERIVRSFGNAFRLSRLTR